MNRKSNYKNVLSYTRLRINQLKKYKYDPEISHLDESDLNILSKKDYDVYFYSLSSKYLSKKDLLSSNISILENFHDLIKKNHMNWKNPLPIILDKNFQITNIKKDIQTFEEYYSSICVVENNDLLVMLKKIKSNLKTVTEKYSGLSEISDMILDCIDTLLIYKATVYDLQNLLKFFISHLKSIESDLIKNYDLFCCLMLWLNFSNKEILTARKILTCNSVALFNEFIDNIYKLHFNSQYYLINTSGNIEKTKETIKYLDNILLIYQEIIEKYKNPIDFSKINSNLSSIVNNLTYNKTFFSTIINELINNNVSLMHGKISTNDYIKFINTSKQELTKLHSDFNILYEEQIFSIFINNLFNVKYPKKLSKIFSKSELNFIFSKINAYGLKSLFIINENYYSLKEAIN